MLETKAKLHIYMPFSIKGGKETLERYFLTNCKEEFKSLVFIGEEIREEDEEEALLSLAYFESELGLTEDEVYTITQKLLDEIFADEQDTPAFQIYEVENN